MRPRLWLAIVAALVAFVLIGGRLAAAEDSQEQNRQFQAAVAQYKAGQFAEAAAKLEPLERELPQSFEVHELVGLVYAAQSQNAKAMEQFEAAVRLKPESAPARANLATSLTHAGKLDAAAEQLREAIALDPANYQANHNLAEIYLQSGKIADALPLLQQAQRSNQASYDNTYDLAQAYFLTGRLGDARQLVQQMLQQRDTGELHNLLGQIDEKDGKFVDAATEFEAAAQMEPSEDNLFRWGSELLLHRTYEPAIDVFHQGTLRYPQSQRLMIGLGMSLYSRGLYDEAIRSLLGAADLNPADPRCYLFLSKAYDSSPNQAEAVIERFRRYAELQPGNGLAQYYYAMSLWKGRRAEDSGANLNQVESLLLRSVALDGSLADAHLQLGILYSGQHEYAKSLPEYTRALQLDPNLADAHYRLGQYYVHAGQKDQAQQEFAVFQKLRAQRQAQVDKERAEVEQFVYSAKATPATKPASATKP